MNSALRLLLILLSLTVLGACPSGDDDDDVADDDDATDDDDDDATDDDDDASEFACGSGLTCDVGSEFCEIGYPGVPGPASYTCFGVPEACQPDPDCPCVLDGAAWDCVEAPVDAITISIYYP